MSASTSGAGGVRNLRAMFEHKASDLSTSPPSRGRSPNGSATSSHSRPVSKVRASFVSVEGPGLPLQASPQKTSGTSNMDGARDEMSSDTQNKGVQPLQKQVTPWSDGPGLGVILKGSAFESGSPMKKKKGTNQPEEMATQSNATEAEKKPISVPTKSQSQAQPALGKARAADPVPSKLSTNRHDVVRAKPEDAKQKPATTQGKETKEMPKLNTKPSPSTAAKKLPTPVRTTVQSQPADSTAPASANSNGPTFKPRGGVAKIRGVMDSAERAKQARLVATKEPKLSPVATKLTTAPKEKVKSSSMPEDAPPVSPNLKKLSKLPSAATASTAASSAKADSQVHSGSSQSKTTDKAKTAQPPKATQASARSSLAKKTSRASLTKEVDRPKSRVSLAGRPAEESFLARMTRPTASSAQKAHDKVQVNSSSGSGKGLAETKDVMKKPARKSLNTGRSVNGKDVEIETVTKSGELLPRTVPEAQAQKSDTEAENASRLAHKEKEEKKTKEANGENGHVEAVDVLAE